MILYVYKETDKSLVVEFTTSNNLSFTKTYSGSGDGSGNYDDDDCAITLKVEVLD